MAAFPGNGPISPTTCAATSTEIDGAEATPVALDSDGTQRRTLYGRRQGPRLSERQRRLLDTRLPALAIDLSGAAPIVPATLFESRVERFRLEIGFGGGEHLAAQAASHREVGFIGVEPFRNGVAKLLGRIEELGLTNIRLVVDDARLLLDRLPRGSLERIDVLFPDPWPKARHHKRRIINAASVAQFAGLLSDGGMLHAATDDRGYARAILAVLLDEPRLTWTARCARDWRTGFPGSVITRYEEKARAAGRHPTYLAFIRR